MAKLIASSSYTITDVVDGTGLANVTNFYLASNQSTDIEKPADVFNIIRNGAYPTNTQHWSGQMIVSQHNFYYNGQKKLFLLQNAGTAETTASTNRFEVKRNTNYTLSFYAFAGSNVRNSDVYFLGRKSNETDGFTSVNAIISERRFLSSKAEYVAVTFNSGDNDSGYIRFDNNGSTNGTNAWLFFGEIMLVEGKEPKPWVASILDSGWTTTPQPISNDTRFLWNYRIELYTDGTTKATEPAVIGVYGEKGIPGQTPYVHWAYSDNADGSGMSTTDTGQRYIGHYSDYTQADSTDKTKYKWADRWANIDVGGKNYIRDFGFAKSYNFINNQSLWKYERIADSTARSGYYVKATCTQAGGGGFHRYLIDLRGSEWQGRTMTYSIDVKASKAVRMRLGVEAFNKGYKAFDVTTDWQRFISTDTVNFRTYYSFPFYTNSITWLVGDIIYLRDPQLEDGTVATTPRFAEEDIQADIDSKADQSLTLAQKRELEERMGIIESELKARALLAEMDAWFDEYTKYKTSLATDKAESETKLTTLSNRVDTAVKDLGGMSVRWNFLDTYMKPGNEGLMIGKIDGTTSIRVSDNRIAFYSGGKEVAFISNDTLEIENGIFTTQLQVGRFQTSQYGPNPDANIVRYVG